MNRRAVAVAITTAAITLLAVAPAAYAKAQGGGGKTGWGKGVLGPGGVTVVVGAGGRPPLPQPPPEPSSGPKSPVYYVAVPCTESALNGEVCLPDGQLGLVPVPAGPGLLGNLPPGDTVPLYVEIVNSLNGKVVGYAGRTVCGGPVPAPPPPPPPAVVVWRAALLPLAQIGFDPGTYGVTQLPTWFWLANDAEGVDVRAAVPGGVGGYAVALAVHPVAYYWSFGDGRTAVSYTAGAPGSAASASTTHTYSEPGTFPVGVTVAWAGSYTFTGYGISETVPLGPVDQPQSSFSYVVQQVRSVLVPPGGA